MKYRQCGNSDLNLSVIGTGCWAFGGGEYWGQQAQKDVNEVVHAAVDLGINYFDTAEAYNEGRSEISLGEAMKGLSRDKFIIGTKVSPSNCYPETLIEHCNASLKRLQTDYIDIYMIHWPIHAHSIKHFTNSEKIISNPPLISEAIETLLKLQKSGKIKQLGISNFSHCRMLEDLPSDAGFVVNELPYNLLCRAIEFDTLPYCTDRNIGVIGYMTLLQGILAGKYANLTDVRDWQKRTRHFNSQNNALCRHGETGFEEETNDALKSIANIAHRNGLKMGDLAVQWTVSNPAITCSLVGARNIDQLKQNIHAASIELSKEVIEELNEVTNHLKFRLENHFDYYENKLYDRTK